MDHKPFGRRMRMRNFVAMLRKRWAMGLFVCVGLDVDPASIPEDLGSGCKSLVAFQRMEFFLRSIVEATCGQVCGFKLNLAFYLQQGGDGIRLLLETCEMIRRIAPEVPVILDAKFGDVDNTNKAYARFISDACGADAVTVNPYAGMQALEPFMDNPNRGVIVLCHTSNEGAEFLQEMPVLLDQTAFRQLLDSSTIAPNVLRDWGICKLDGFDVHTLPMYQYVALSVAKRWNSSGNCGLVMGATFPSQLAVVRALVGDMPLLIPGIGTQGGDLEATVKAGRNNRGEGMIINSSRGILFASKGPDFDEAARKAVQNLSGMIGKCLNPAKQEV